jgi:hypothetical protein
MPLLRSAQSLLLSSQRLRDDTLTQTACASTAMLRECCIARAKKARSTWERIEDARLPVNN